VTVWIGLTLALVSAITVNWAYTKEHEAVQVGLPPLSARRPVASARALLRSRAWLFGFGGETVGWLVYVAALRLAPLALVQAVSASGIAVLALIQSRGHPSRLVRRDRLAVRLALLGLVLLAISLVGSHPTDHAPHPVAAVVWLGACFGASVLVSAVRLRLQSAVALGLAAGLLFAAGDISAKLVVLGGWWLLGLVPLVAAYAAGSIELQAAFQHGNALTAAGTATLATNALPIIAGVLLFDQSLPSGWQRVLQLVAFAAIVASGTLLNDPRVASSEEADRPTPRPGRARAEASPGRR
jgi:hypothetical protein